MITFYRRGTGASDAPSGGELPPWEQWADDAQTVMDVVGSQAAVLCGLADSVPAAILFAGTHPSRTAGLVLMNGEASPFPAVSEEELAARIQLVSEAWVDPLWARSCSRTSWSETRLLAPGSRGPNAWP